MPRQLLRYLDLSWCDGNAYYLAAIGLDEVSRHHALARARIEHAVGRLELQLFGKHPQEVRLGLPLVLCLARPVASVLRAAQHHVVARPRAKPRIVCSHTVVLCVHHFLLVTMLIL